MATSVAADTDPEWLVFAGVPLLAAALPSQTLRGDRSVRHRTPARAVVFRRGDPASHLVVLLRGTLVSRVETPTAA